LLFFLFILLIKNLALLD